MTKHNPEERAITDWVGNKRITWCGPFAIATVCGTKYETAYRTVRAIRGKRHAKGVTATDIKKSCTKLGVKGKWTNLPKRKKLAKFLPTLEAGKVYIVEVTRHVIVVDTRDYTTIDNQNPDWTAVESTKHLRKLVHRVFEIENPKLSAPADYWLFPLEMMMAA